MAEVKIPIDSKNYSAISKARYLRNREEINKKVYKKDPIGHLVRLESDAFRDDFARDHNLESSGRGARERYDRIYAATIKGMSKENLKKLKKAMAKRREEEYRKDPLRHDPRESY